LYDPDLMTGDATVTFTDLAQAGTFSVIYTYTAVPEPAGAATLAGVVVLMVRFRRPRRR
jgi:hypothetical protein